MDHTVPVLKNCNNGAISAALIDRGEWFKKTLFLLFDMKVKLGSFTSC